MILEQLYSTYGNAYDTYIIGHLLSAFVASFIAIYFNKIVRWPLSCSEMVVASEGVA